MSETKHTPGPWKVGNKFNHLNNTVIPIEYHATACNSCGKSDGTYLVAWLFRNALPKAEHLPNAHLIAAAPDLLASLKRCAELCEPHSAAQEAKLVIAKAEGRV